MNEHTSLEKYNSNTLFSKGLRKGREMVDIRYMWDGADSNILTPSSSDYSSTSFSFCWAGLLNRGSLSAASPLSRAGSHCPEQQLQLQLTDSN